jgi:SAM-dependent methyltransferase
MASSPEIEPAPGLKANLDRWSAEDDAWRGYRRQGERLVLEQRVQRTLSLVQSAPGGALLDVGCATGRITLLVAELAQVTKVAGVDAVIVSPLVPSVVANLDSRCPLPFKTASFDIVTCLETLEHVHDTDYLASEIRRVLKPSGYALLSVPRLDGILSIMMLAFGLQPPAVECSVRKRYGSGADSARVSGHVSHFTRKAFEEFAAASGWSIEMYAQASIYSSWLLALKEPPPIWKRLPLWVLSKIPAKQDVQIVRMRPL